MRFQIIKFFLKLTDLTFYCEYQICCHKKSLVRFYLIKFVQT